MNNRLTLIAKNGTPLDVLGQPAEPASQPAIEPPAPDPIATPGAIPLLKWHKIDQKIGRVGKSSLHIRERMFLVTFSVGDKVFKAGLTRPEAEMIMGALVQSLEAQ